MNPIKSVKNLTKFELALWGLSILLIIVSFLLSPEKSPLSLAASLIGATALIFVSKGDALGQLLTVVFAVIYAIISYSFAYYGEMATYLFMTAPIAVMAVISWLRHPYNDSEVEVKTLTGKETALMLALTVGVTAAFYFILGSLGTANLVVSTVSVTTSFLASYLTFRRSPLYALAYAANDIVLIVLWTLASINDSSYIPVTVCFVVFFANDMYGFFNWSRMKKRQAGNK